MSEAIVKHAAAALEAAWCAWLREPENRHCDSGEVPPEVLARAVLESLTKEAPAEPVKLPEPVRYLGPPPLPFGSYCHADLVPPADPLILAGWNPDAILRTANAAKDDAKAP